MLVVGARRREEATDIPPTSPSQIPIKPDLRAKGRFESNENDVWQLDFFEEPQIGHIWYSNFNPETRRIFQWILFEGGEGEKINLFYNYGLLKYSSFNKHVTYFKFLIARHCAKYIGDKDNYIFVGVWFLEHTTLNSL